MINAVLAFSVRQRWLVLLVSLLAAALGVFALTRLPIDAVPDITNNQVQVNAVVPSLSPFDVEKQVTYPIETALAGIPGLEYTRSLSRNGFAQVTAVFSEKTDLYFAARLRGGLSMVFHLGDRVDLHFNGSVSHIGSEFNGPVSYFFGGGLVIAWDDPPSTVLPSKERLKGEQCKEIYNRFTECPFYPKLVKKARAQGYQKCKQECGEAGNDPNAPGPSPYAKPETAPEGPPAP